MRKRIYIPAIIVGVFIIGYFGYSAYVVESRAPATRLPVQGLPSDVGLTYEDVEFRSRGDDTLLKGWLIPGREDATVIMVSGWCHNRADSNIGILQLCRDLHNEGLTLLLFDLRGRGESEGVGVVLTHDDKDIGGAVDYVRSRGYNDVSLLAFSAGAATSLRFASQDQVTAVVSDSSFADIKELFVGGGAKLTGIPGPIISFLVPGVKLMAKLMYGYDGVDPASIVTDVDCPVFFIHGRTDTGIPSDNSFKLYDSRTHPDDELWIVANAEHVQSYKTDPVEYVQRVVGFLRNWRGY